MNRFLMEKVWAQTLKESSSDLAEAFKKSFLEVDEGLKKFEDEGYAHELLG